MANHARNALSGPISIKQFLQGVQQAWHSNSRLTSSQQAGPLPRRLGIAVSGGADSMALAHLCKQLETSKLIDGLSVKGFIVDHKAREESSREAKTVASWLADLGVESEILELQWREDAQSVTAFETHARRLRFQALGHACIRNRIQALLMGHHRDDNVETTIWRLCTGARGAGLAGIPPLSRIPECHGVYGLHGSGSFITMKGQQRNPPWVHLNPQTKEVMMSFQGSSLKNTRTTDIKVSSGGILICRPLLSFTKSMLVETCEHNQVPYVSDPSNFDPTLTPRNTIRSLRSAKKLPQALEAPSILSLTDTSQALMRRATRLSNDLLRSCTFHKFNPAVGTMILEFPPPSPPPPSSTTRTTRDVTTDPLLAGQVQAMTLRRITEILSPAEENHYSLTRFEPFAELVFPQDKPATKRQPFTVGGVMFRPAIYNDAPERATNWLLSRQPYMRHWTPEIRLEIPATPLHPSAGGSIRTPWTLWDSRYWFRVRSPPSKHGTSRYFTVRPLQQADIRQIQKQLYILAAEKSNAAFGSYPQFQEILGREAIGHIRFTLPILTENHLEGGIAEDLLALPTIGVPLARCDVEWEWMYKSIDTEVLRLMGRK